MRRSLLFVRRWVAPSTLASILLWGSTYATEPVPVANGRLQVVQVQAKEKEAEKPKAETPPTAPTQPTQPTQPQQPTAPGAGAAAAPTGLGAATNPFGSSQAPTSTTSSGGTAPGGSAGATGAEATGRASGDVGDLLSRSQSGTGVEVQRRNPIITDPRVRGYHQGELLTQVDGAFVIPSRLDLDTIVSKIDPSALRNVLVIKGPYSARYGPGLAFIDAETLGSPRYENGFEAHGSTSLQYKTNGVQTRGRQTFFGGSSDWGYRIGYDIFSGSDYRSGNDTQMPSSFNSQNIDFAMGFDFTCNSHLEIHILRQDLHDVEFPGQVFDINKQITDGYTVRYTLDHQEYFDKMVFDAWYNYTRFDGDTTHPSKLRQIPQLASPQINLQGFTDADTIAPGFRHVFTWGQEKEAQFSVGVDMRYISQKLNEFDTRALAAGFSNNPIPRSHSSNPGLLADAVLPVNDRLTVRAGARFDIYSTDVDKVPTAVFPPNPNLAGTPAMPVSPEQILASLYQTNKFDNEYYLLMGFVTGEYKLTDHVTPFANFGIGNRPPTLTELYAAGPFLAVVQNGLNSVFGNPRLSPEDAWQIEVGSRFDYERFRGNFSLYYSWIHNYITFQTEQAVPVQVLRFVNTEQATLSGAELTGEYDATPWLTPFGTMNFVEGRDKTRDGRGQFVQPQQFTYTDPATGKPFVLFSPTARNSLEEPLPGIPPMEFRLGLRFHEAVNTRDQAPRWGIETTARIVMAQGRIAQSLQEQKTGGFTVFDLRTFWQANKNLLLTAGVENLLDRNYREHLDLRTGTIPIPNSVTGVAGPTGPGVLQPGINFYFGAQLTY
jgi:iron complex outermembrane recepter protein